MEVQHVAPGRLGFEHWTLRCIKCGLIQDAQAQADPMTSEAVGWFNGELQYYSAGQNLRVVRLAGERDGVIERTRFGVGKRRRLHLSSPPQSF